MVCLNFICVHGLAASPIHKNILSLQTLLMRYLACQGRDSDFLEGGGLAVYKVLQLPTLVLANQKVRVWLDPLSAICHIRFNG